MKAVTAGPQADRCVVRRHQFIKAYRALPLVCVHLLKTVGRSDWIANTVECSNVRIIGDARRQRLDLRCRIMKHISGGTMLWNVAPGWSNNEQIPSGDRACCWSCRFKFLYRWRLWGRLGLCLVCSMARFMLKVLDLGLYRCTFLVQYVTKIHHPACSNNILNEIHPKLLVEGSQ